MSSHSLSQSRDRHGRLHQRPDGSPRPDPSGRCSPCSRTDLEPFLIARSWTNVFLYQKPNSVDHRPGNSVVCVAAFTPHNAFSSEDSLYFEKHIRPILRAHCLDCHGSGRTQRSTRPATGAIMHKGGDSGPAINLEQRIRACCFRRLNRVKCHLGTDISSPKRFRLCDHGCNRRPQLSAGT